jgi:3-deoxy-D-manno-octulosonic-acid transferase
MSSRPKFFIWKLLYNLIAVPLMYGGFHFAAFLARLGSHRFDKIRSGIAGRKALFADLAAQLQKVKNAGPRFWIHAASMGEYEQARPLLQEIGQRFPEVVRVLTLFSPSAYANLNRANIPAEAVSYLPFDSVRSARRFLRLVNPNSAIVIRHDIWPNHLWEAQRRGVKLVLADASVSANARSWRYKPGVRNFNRSVFAAFDAVCAVSAEATQSLKALLRHPERLVVTGDTRYDQVLFRTQSKKIEDVLPEEWRDGAMTFVAGSTWPSDEEVLLPAYVAARKPLPHLRMILVPHEPTPEHLAQLEKRLADFDLVAVRLSQLTTESEMERNGVRESERKGEGRGAESALRLSPFTRYPLPPSVLLIDRIGILAILYSAGQVAFVGGSFGPGVHSVLEAAVHGVPVLVGPRFHNSPEAVELAAKDLLASVANAEECRQKLLELFQNPELRQEKGARHREFVLARCGASARVVEILERAMN